MKSSFYKKLFDIIAVIVIGATFYSCGKSANEGNLSFGISGSDYFQGVITLEEDGALANKALIKITLNDGDVQRDVETADGENYGMIYKGDEDSVTYYYKKEQKYYHTAIPKKDFKIWVDSMIRPQLEYESFSGSSDLKEPFGTIFSPFKFPGNNVLLKTFKTDLKYYGNAQCQTFIIGKDLICNVFYSNDIKIKPEILDLLEAYQPTSVSTIALAVLYTTADPETDGNIGDKIFNKMNKLSTKLEKNIHFKGANLSDRSGISLPKNSKRISIQEMSNVIRPPEPSDGNSSGHGHHHDFF